MNFGISLGFFTIVAAIYILWQIRQLLMLLFTAIVLATILNIVVKKFENWKIKRFLAIPLSLSLLLTVVGILVGTIATLFVDRLEKLINLVPQGIEQLNQWRDWIVINLHSELVLSLPDINEAFASLQEQLQPLLNRLLGEGLSFFLTRLERQSAFCYC